MSLSYLQLILPDFGEFLDKFCPSQELHEIFIMGDNNQLEVTLALASLDDSTIRGKDI